MDRKHRGGVIAAVLIVAAVAGVAVGAGLAWQTSGTSRQLKGVGPAPWYTAEKIGDKSTGMLTRAVVARTGIWALPPSEVVYFVADVDDQAEPLRRECVYEIAALRDPPTRWWSISLYRDNFWIDNPSDRYSFSKTSVARAPDGAWRVLVSGEPQPGNWLPMGSKSGVFSLSIRLYQPDPSIAADPERAPLPSLRRLSCA